MEVITEEYYKCLNNRDRIAILSLVARILPLGLIREYIPGLTPYMFHKARLFAIRNRHANLEDRDTSRQKYCKPIVQDFVSFLVRFEKSSLNLRNIKVLVLLSPLAYHSALVL
mgnify:CR=1 FL=1